MAVSKHDRCIYIDNQVFNVKGYQRSVTDDLVSRFGSPEQGQTNLDLLKAVTQKSFRGGMFQRVFDDPEAVSSIVEGYYNPIDESLYMTPDWIADNETDDMDALGVHSWCLYNGDIYYTYRRANPPDTSKNRIVKMDPITQTKTILTIPAALENNGYPLRLTAFAGYIFVATQAVAATHRYDGTTFTDVSLVFGDFKEFNGSLYGVGIGDNAFCAITNYTSTPITYSVINFVYNRTTGQPPNYQGMIEYNGALYVMYYFGMYRYDGVTFKPLINMKHAESQFNFKCSAVWNGRFYYTIKNKLYEFDGINITLLQEFSDAYTINYLVGDVDRLWIGTRNNADITYSDKLGEADQYTHSVFAYNGIGFFEYHQFPAELILDYTIITIIPAYRRVFAIVPDVYLNVSSEPRSNGYNVHALNLDDEFTLNNLRPTSNRSLVITSSEIDHDYPAVPKTLLGTMLNYRGLAAGEGYIKIEIQYLYNSTWSNWSEVWNTQNVVSGGAINDYLLYERSTAGSPNLSTSPLIYHKVRYRITLVVTDSTPSAIPRLADMTLRYVLQPRQRRSWLLTLQIDGADNRGLATPTLSDGSRETRNTTYLRKLLYDAHKNKKPVLFYDADFSEIKSTGPIKIQGVNFIDAGETVAVRDTATEADPWINRRVGTATPNSGNDETSITLDPFGSRIGIGGSSSASSTIATGAQLRKSHVVYVKRIMNERYILDDNSINVKNNHSDIRSDIVVELVEV